ncbi:MAG: hypothetical protein JNM58_10545 [Xanthomonadaceae bacterium]|nr:hypothetical protein [Xanthomonadaceae bacterium]
MSGNRPSWATLFAALLLIAGAALPARAQTQNATTPGATTAPYPTLQSLTLEWAVSGDSNRNGVVNVRYRVQGEAQWQQAMPLRRIPGGLNQGFQWANRHSGSLFDLRPGTTYDIELSLSDPDGGQETRVISATTRNVPRPANDAVTKPVTPGDLSVVIANAQPGDILLLGPGTYQGFVFGKSGTAERPIVIRGQPGAVIEGELGMFSRSHVHLDALTVNGRIRFNASNHISITRCTVNASATQFNGDGIVTFLRSENAYIADNLVNGTTTWTEAAFGSSGANRGEGILVTGPGHVIAHNLVSGFRDNISLLEDGEASDQYSIDIIGNELGEAADDAIEADFCFHNCRILRNRVTNAFIAFSSQPGLGGPTYFIRNVAYNVPHVAFKLYRGSSGDVLLHNTIVKAGDAFGLYPGVGVSRLLTRNNLFLGGFSGTYNGFGNGTGAVLAIADLVVDGSSLDFDAFGSETGRFEGRFASTTFSTLASLRGSTSEAHAVQATRAVFARTIAAPSSPLTRYAPQDLRPARNTVLDAGQVLPNINDAFLDVAPDIGAYEAGSDLPEYGPRRPRFTSRPLPPLQRPGSATQQGRPLPRSMPAPRR